jgi:hypothetical protein
MPGVRQSNCDKGRLAEEVAQRAARFGREGGPMSTANTPCQNNRQESEVPRPASEPPRPTEPMASPVPLRQAGDSQFSLEIEGFDFHDTIPAPPWLDDAPEAVEAPLVPLP